VNQFPQHIQESQNLPEMARAAHIIIVLFQAFQAYLVKGGRLYGFQSYKLFFSGWISQDGQAESPVRSFLVQLFKISMEKRIAAGERYLAMDIMAKTELCQVIQDIDFLIQGKCFILIAVIAVATMQIAGLGNMPLQGKNPGREKRPVNIFIILRIAASLYQWLRPNNDPIIQSPDQGRLNRSSMGVTFMGNSRHR